MRWADAPAVDIYMNDTKIAPNLGFAETTNHLAVPGGDYAVKITVAGDPDTVVLETTLAIIDDTASTVVALGKLADLDVGVFSDDISGVAGDTATVQCPERDYGRQQC